jgi:hypothetical protein
VVKDAMARSRRSARLCALGWDVSLHRGDRSASLPRRAASPARRVV